MDFVRLKGDTYSDGEIVKDVRSATWVERYSDFGEFEIKGYPTKALMTGLPLGSLITHTDSRDVMIVESHLIDEAKNNDPELTIKGRSLLSIFESRPTTYSVNIGFNSPGVGGAANVFEFLTAFPWIHARDLMRGMLQTGLVPAALFLAPNVTIESLVTATTPSAVKAQVRMGGPLWPEIKKILDTFDGGVKIERSSGTSNPTMFFYVHNGIDRSATVNFSYEVGDVDKAKYFWTNKGTYNSAYVMAKYYGTLVSPPAGETGFALRVATVEAEDIVGNTTSMSTPELNAFVETITQRGREALKTMKTQMLLEATISPSTRYRYRTDYKIGDKVWVNGNYGASALMRVTEYAETQDENGTVGIPTLSAL